MIKYSKNDIVVILTNKYESEGIPLYSEGIVSAVWEHSCLVEIKIDDKMLIAHPDEINKIN